jgi:gliding motility-associated-like protein
VESGVTEIPNVFTPNNDGIFDTWIIPGALSTPGNKLMIFNRWGSIVKEFNGYKNNWDGDNLPAGTYYYTYDDGKETKNGTITIVR